MHDARRHFDGVGGWELFFCSGNGVEELLARQNRVVVPHLERPDAGSQIEDPLDLALLEPLHQRVHAKAQR
jgi:hypothetical protein